MGAECCANQRDKLISWTVNTIKDQGTQFAIRLYEESKKEMEKSIKEAQLQIKANPNNSKLMAKIMEEGEQQLK